MSTKSVPITVRLTITATNHLKAYMCINKVGRTAAVASIMANARLHGIILQLNGVDSTLPIKADPEHPEMRERFRHTFSIMVRNADYQELQNRANVTKSAMSRVVNAIIEQHSMLPENLVAIKLPTADPFERGVGSVTLGLPAPVVEFFQHQAKESHIPTEDLIRRVLVQWGRRHGMNNVRLPSVKTMRTPSALALIQEQADALAGFHRHDVVAVIPEDAAAYLKEFADRVQLIPELAPITIMAELREADRTTIMRSVSFVEKDHVVRCKVTLTTADIHYVNGLLARSNLPYHVSKQMQRGYALSQFIYAHRDMAKQTAREYAAILPIVSRETSEAGRKADEPQPAYYNGDDACEFIYTYPDHSASGSVHNHIDRINGDTNVSPKERRNMLANIPSIAALHHGYLAVSAKLEAKAAMQRRDVTQAGRAAVASKHHTDMAELAHRELDCSQSSCILCNYRQSAAHNQPRLVPSTQLSPAAP